MELYVCAICADRADRLKQRILGAQPYALRSLTALRERLKQDPPSARILSDPHLREGMIECSLTVGQLNVMLAQGAAFASLPADELGSYWLTIRHALPQHLNGQTILRHYHLVLWYTLPPAPINRNWEWRAFTLYEAEPPRFDSAGFHRCWCQRKEDNNVV